MTNIGEDEGSLLVFWEVVVAAMTWPLCPHALPLAPPKYMLIVTSLFEPLTPPQRHTRRLRHPSMPPTPGHHLTNTACTSATPLPPQHGHCHQRHPHHPANTGTPPAHHSPQHGCHCQRQWQMADGGRLRQWRRTVVVDGDDGCSCRPPPHPPRRRRRPGGGGGDARQCRCWESECREGHAEEDPASSSPSPSAPNVGPPTLRFDGDVQWRRGVARQAARWWQRRSLCRRRPARYGGKPSMEVVRHQSALLTSCKKPFWTLVFDVWGTKADLETRKELLRKLTKEHLKFYSVE